MFYGKKEALVFISHSSQDSEIAKKIAYFLKSVFIMDEDEVFCSSDYSIHAGNQFNESIKIALNQAKIHIYLISNNFFNRYYCLCELGASCILEKEILIFLFYLQFLKKQEIVANI